MRFSLEFGWNEGKILDAMYEVADGTYDLNMLIRKIEPTVQTGTPEAGKAVAEVRDAIERLIMRGYMRGQRTTGVDGVYFKKLRLTPKGERAAIKQRKEIEDLKNQPPSAKESADRFIETEHKS